MKPIVIFGAGKIAEVILYYFKHHSERSVVAVTVDDHFVTENSCFGLPLVSFESLEEKYSPDDYEMFVALGYQELNRFRALKCEEAQQKGYSLVSYVDPRVGLPLDCEIGDNCFIMQGALIHPRVKLGNNVFVWGGATVGHHTCVGSNCWLTSGCTVAGSVTVGENCFFAVNSSIAHGVRVGDDCFIGANALVNKCTGNMEVFLHEPTNLYRLNSKQFLRLSNFS
jgi:sugar O-acyltransferase (sialic acid O-acetyltransferase NeuD family)